MVGVAGNRKGLAGECKAGRREGYFETKFDYKMLTKTQNCKLVADQIRPQNADQNDAAMIQLSLATCYCFTDILLPGTCGKSQAPTCRFALYAQMLMVGSPPIVVSSMDFDNCRSAPNTAVVSAK